MENMSDSLMPRPLLLCLKSEKIVCYSVPDNSKELNGVIDRNEDFICIIKLMNGNVFGEEVLGNGVKETGEDLII